MSASPKILAALRTIESALVASSVHGMSPFWRDTYERFYLHPTARVLIACVGRGGDKSRESVVSALAEVLAFEGNVPIGERHYFTHIAENVAEATKTLRILEQYLRIIGIPFVTRSGDTLDLESLPLGFKVLACRIGAVSGWRCIGWTADESAKWSSEGVDPSEEVVASIRAMTVTHPTARGRMISSPLATDGYFHRVWSADNSDSVLAVHAASWEANPSITEAATRALEPDERVWLREYAAIPQAAILRGPRRRRRRPEFHDSRRRLGKGRARPHYRCFERKGRFVYLGGLRMEPQRTRSIPESVRTARFVAGPGGPGSKSRAGNHRAACPVLRYRRWNRRQILGHDRGR